MKFISLVSILLLSFVFADQVEAASVAKVKGRKVLIKAEGTDLEVGSIFYIVSENGKKRGLVKIRAVKGNKAIGVISKKSKALKGWTLKKRTRKVSKRRKRKRKDDEYDPRSAIKSIAVGAVGGANIGSMTVSKIGEEGSAQGFHEAKLSGTGFSFKGLVDYKLFNAVWFRGMVGIESLALEDAEGPKRCGTVETGFNKACLVEISYVTLDLHARYVFGIGTLRPWVGGGIDLLFPMSSESTALKEDSIETANTFVAAGGIDYHVSPNWMIPIAAEFNFFPSSDTVAANFIAIRLGVAYKF